MDAPTNARLEPQENRPRRSLRSSCDAVPAAGSKGCWSRERGRAERLQMTLSRMGRHGVSLPHHISCFSKRVGPPALVPLAALSPEDGRQLFCVGRAADELWKVIACSQELALDQIVGVKPVESAGLTKSPEPSISSPEKQRISTIAPEIN